MHQLNADTGCCLDDLQRALADREGLQDRKSKEYVLSVRLDDDDGVEDDDDDDEYYQSVKTGFSLFHFFELSNFVGW